jgi:hypothetical protein
LDASDAAENASKAISVNIEEIAEWVINEI